jgi:hypothetical protein
MLISVFLQNITKVIFMTKQTDDMAFLNLHEVFLNVTMCHKHMSMSPLIHDVTEFTISDRGRFERMWIMFLYVLVEAWKSNEMAGARLYISSKADTTKVDQLIEQGRENGSITKMRSVRDYMCHRDRREYWDDGRLAVAGQLDYNESLYQAFSKLFLEFYAARKNDNKPKDYI